MRTEVLRRWVEEQTGKTNLSMWLGKVATSMPPPRKATITEFTSEAIRT